MTKIDSIETLHGHDCPRSSGLVGGAAAAEEGSSGGGGGNIVGGSSATEERGGSGGALQQCMDDSRKDTAPILSRQRDSSLQRSEQQPPPNDSGFANLNGWGDNPKIVATPAKTAALPTSQHPQELDTEADWFTQFSEYKDQSRDPLSNTFSSERPMQQKLVGEALPPKKKVTLCGEDLFNWFDGNAKVF